MSRRIDSETGRFLWAVAFRDVLLTSFFSTLIALAVYFAGLAPSIGFSIIISHVFGLTNVFGNFIWDLLKPKTPKIVKSLTALCASVILGTLSFMAIHYYANIPLENGIEQFLRTLLLASTFGGAVVYYFYAKDQNHAVRERLRLAQLERARNEKQLVESQLKTLQSQIEPHFLFNTLANVQAMMHTDSQTASELLDRLTLLLRKSMKNHRESFVSLDEELAFIQAFLDIQQVRLAERLQVKWRVDAKLDQQFQLPPLLIQPLVENALKHGIEPKAEGGQLTISIQLIGHQLVQISVIDDGVGLNNPGTSGHGIGLANTKERLRSLYGHRARFYLQENPQGGVTSTIELPYEQTNLYGTDH